ncbi:putative claudin-25 [Galemys pyrenaicus]|uniref:Putative claudin-25 n=1 Tax=Galemys pyrenaicus TaxID=202257 RepID=A0A8J6AE77_GALPY|nr:putative claudin-25 [Galemys pyrenaicus]
MPAAESSRFPLTGSLVLTITPSLNSALGLATEMRSGELRLVKGAGLWGSAAGQLCSLVALCLPQWLTLSSGLLESERYFLGLWQTCVTQDTGDSVCQASSGQGDLTANLLVARILMCVACVTGSLGLVAVLLGVIWPRDRAHLGSCLERGADAAGGALLCLAGVATLVPVSYIAHVTLQRFWGPESPTNTPRWEFGSAMFSGWIGGFLLVTGGLLLIVSRLCARRLAENLTSFPPKLDFSRAVSFRKVDFV